MLKLKAMTYKSICLHGVDLVETPDSKDDPFMKVIYERPETKYNVEIRMGNK